MSRHLPPTSLRVDHGVVRATDAEEIFGVAWRPAVLQFDDVMHGIGEQAALLAVPELVLLRDGGSLSTRRTVVVMAPVANCGL